MTGRRVLFLGIFVSILLTYAIWLGGSIPASIIKLPDQGLNWYYWKLPNPTFWSRATAWSMYLGHQFSIWACIWWAQRSQLKYKYHPMEATLGHLVGFLYMFLLLLQSSLIFNRTHVNRWWTFTLEISVLLHSVVVSWMLGQSKWPTFLFGFLGILVLTQLHGLPVGISTKRIIYGAFLVSVLAVYGLTERGLGRIYEVTYIPLIEFGLVGAIYLIFLLILWTISRLPIKT
ncbi:hypothetical protein GS682_26430 [Nostoc sp. B(2019)]|nr:hypothetical protein [Nostoc sp. B(2019)]